MFLSAVSWLEKVVLPSGGSPSVYQSIGALVHWCIGLLVYWSFIGLGASGSVIMNSCSSAIAVAVAVSCC